MTLIVAAKEGLYADFRKIYMTGSITLPTLASKIHVSSDRRLYALGMTGRISTDHYTTGSLGFYASVWSFYRWYSREWKPEYRNSPLINLSACLTALFERILNGYMKESQATVILIITPHHTLTIDKESPIIESLDSLATTGSSENAAALLYNAGYSVPQIYSMAAKIDSLITADFEFIPRKNLVSAFPQFLFEQIVRHQGTEFGHDITDEEFRWLFLAELLNIELFIKTKRKSSPTETQLKRVWDIGGKIYDKIMTRDIEIIKKDVHELYSIKR